jgi:hypothetical protein
MILFCLDLKLMGAANVRNTGVRRKRRDNIYFPFLKKHVNVIGIGKGNAIQYTKSWWPCVRNKKETRDCFIPKLAAQTQVSLIRIERARFFRRQCGEQVLFPYTIGNIELICMIF